LPKTVFIIADAAIELVPKEIYNYAKAPRHSNKSIEKILLDSTYHYKPMRELPDFRKRGRPDIVHLCLLNILNTPLVKRIPEKIRILIHTYDDQIIEINPRTRIPKHYLRFVGLIESLFEKGIIQTKNMTLLKILTKTTIIKEITNCQQHSTIAFSSKGDEINLGTFFDNNKTKNLTLITGGFPYGNISNKILEKTDKILSLGKTSLDAWIVLSRIVYDREKAIFD
jgi:rRNA small subunit pseudouridine methyltransferase Nep1